MTTATKKAPAMKASDFYSILATEDVSASQVKEVFLATEKLVLQQLSKHGEVKVPLLGKFVKKITPAGDRYNPFTKQTKMMPEKIAVKFRVAKGIKDGIS